MESDMSKFKIGDKVVITAKERPSYFNQVGDMDKYLNKKMVAIITGIDIFSSYEIDNKWTIKERDLALAKENCKSFYNNKVVVYFNKDGKKGVAVNTDKKFDLEKGLAFAMLKTFGVTYTQFKEELKKLENREMKPKFKKIEVTTIGDNEKQFIKVEKQKDPIKKMIKKFEKGAKNGKRNTEKNNK
jgi:hypothetical protein